MSGAFDIQKAFFVKLRADSTLDSLLARALDDNSKPAVYDDVPEYAPFPYVTVGDLTELEWDTDDSTGREGTYTFHVWSRYRGRMEVKKILDAIKASLHNQSLTVSGELVVLVLFEFVTIFKDPDGITQHGVTRFRVISTGT